MREIVAELPPEFVMLAERVLALPICTLPKLRLAGFAFSVAAVVATVPESPIFSIELDELLTIAKLPEVVPVPEGAKVTVKLVL